MNRTEYDRLLQEIYGEIDEKGGNFQGQFGDDGATAKQAKLMAAVALIAVDRYYSHLTKFKKDHPEI